LKGGVSAWKNAGKPVSIMNSITAAEFAKNIEQKNIIDVRNAGEWKNGVIEQAKLISLADLEKQLSSLNKQQHYYIHCAGGYRSMMAASLMKKNGFAQVTNVKGGIAKIQEEQVPLVEPIIAQ
jgi:rhodanese-related sulfurtransferase